MKKWIGFISILLSSVVVSAQQDSIVKLDQIAHFGKVEWWNFDTALIPLHREYDYSWDSLNVDEPKFSGVDSMYGIKFIMSDTTCQYFHPCSGPITSKYGWRRGRLHKGIDIDLQTGDPVYAAFDGVIRISKYNAGGYGNYVLIRHYNGLETIYGHLSERYVEPNQTVVKGQIIGLGGSTGRSTGSHLHFETRYKGEAINPMKVISFDDKTILGDTLYFTVKDFAPRTNTSAYQKQAAKNGKYHKIKSGDSLWAISRKYGVSISQICRLNGISTKTTLKIGRTLRIR